MLFESACGKVCRALGYNEIITYSFVSPEIFDRIRLPEDSKLRNPMRIQNPLGEDTSVMRTTALPSMLDILSRNMAYRNKSVKLYELAKIYLPKVGQLQPEEPKILVLGGYGENVDFFSIKGELEAVFSALRIKKASYVADRNNPSYHPGRCAAVSVDGVHVGYIGQLHPLVAENYDMDAPVYCAEINMEALICQQLPEPTYKPLPKFPTVTRDLAIVCSENVTVAEAEAVIRKSAGKLLRDVVLFDIYRGANIGESKKSLAFSLSLRADDRTLTDADSEQVVTNILTVLAKELDATLR